MFKVGNLGGTLFKDKVPIVSFKFCGGQLCNIEVLTSDSTKLPMELHEDGINEQSLLAFFESRITPDSRDGIHELLASTPVKYYDPERIIRYNKGRCIHDKYWLECDDDNKCWENS